MLPVVVFPAVSSATYVMLLFPGLRRLFFIHVHVLVWSFSSSTKKRRMVLASVIVPVRVIFPVSIVLLFMCDVIVRFGEVISLRIVPVARFPGFPVLSTI